MGDDEALVTLIVFDTGPLITLAAADSLDYLEIPNAPVYVPDAVYYEATKKAGALGAQSIGAWVQDHPEVVRVMPTATYELFDALRSNPTITPEQLRQAERGMGERAALEFIDKHLERAAPHDRALLIVEDGNAARVARLEPEVIVAFTTDFLNALEHEGRINSAEAVLQRAEDAGRHVSRLQLLSEDRAKDLEAVRRVAAVSQRQPRGQENDLEP